MAHWSLFDPDNGTRRQSNQSSQLIERKDITHGRQLQIRGTSRWLMKRPVRLRRYGSCGRRRARRTAVERPSWQARHNTLLTLIAASIVPALYLGYVNHFAINALQGDDWNTVPGVNDAIHGHFSLGQLWTQYSETRIPLVRAVFDIWGVVDHLDTRPLILFNALLFIAAFGLVLALCRRYIERP